MEMARVFNMGLGMLFVVSEAEKNKAMDILNELKPNDAFFVGKIIPREDKDPVVFSGNIL